MFFHLSKIIFLSISFTLTYCCSATSSKNVYSTGVKGIVTCNGTPAKNVKVQIYDKNAIGKDTEISYGFSDEKGRFGIRGNEKVVIGNFNPYYAITHNCNNDNQICKRKFTNEINKKYIEKNTRSYDVYDAGVIELAPKRSNELRDCSV
ncbi:Transthyretin-like family-containing protein [Strongyloides ratti]|uniref:Transthyretin-like family-containing protein n=1 Tax=Strongyloides ratti TaxID=34506 RepID=A0A090LCW5_STRRB|nr:Transthyretin-like family-containing protein [Strongyloides ratti]CEF67621.1 Transthyretin-like family-containing protein [Strongyloides ratti]